MTRVDICVSFTFSNAVATVLMPSLCGILVYKERTSIVTKINAAGNSVILFILLGYTNWDIFEDGEFMR